MAVIPPRFDCSGGRALNIWLEECQAVQAVNSRPQRGECKSGDTGDLPLLKRHPNESPLMALNVADLPQA